MMRILHHSDPLLIYTALHCRTRFGYIAQMRIVHHGGSLITY